MSCRLRKFTGCSEEKLVVMKATTAPEIQYKHSRGSLHDIMMSNERNVEFTAARAMIALDGPLRAGAFDDILKEPLGTDKVLPQLLALCTRLQASDRECMATVEWERLTSN
jgi:hypothetical protein